MHFGTGAGFGGKSLWRFAWRNLLNGPYVARLFPHSFPVVASSSSYLIRVLFFIESRHTHDDLDEDTGNSNLKSRLGGLLSWAKTAFGTTTILLVSAANIVSQTAEHLCYYVNNGSLWRWASKTNFQVSAARIR